MFKSVIDRLRGNDKKKIPPGNNDTKAGGDGMNASLGRNDTRKILRLGLDYGTSASKLVIRDEEAPGGARAYVVGNNNGGYRFPSSVYYVPSDGRLLLGVRPPPGKEAVEYHSIKMRVAEDAVNGEARYFYGNRFDYPRGWSSKDLAVLSVWYLLSEASRWGKSAFPRFGEVLISVTMGIPMSFQDDQRIKAAFLDVIRAAQRLQKIHGLLKESEIEADPALALIKDSLDHVIKNPIDEDRHRAWLRTEAESALFWAFHSPSVPPGLYAKVDIGAGTTNCSTFTIPEAYNEGAQLWRKEKIGFFSALSGCLGTDALHEQMLKTLPNISSSDDLKGKENDILARQADCGIGNLVREIYTEVHQKNWQKARRVYPSEEAWKNFMVIVIGGGGQIDRVRDEFKNHPSPNWKHWSDYHPQLKIMPLSIPDDLFLGDRNGKPKQGDLPFLMVAYGLSNSEFSVPQVTSPQDTPPIRPYRNSVREIEEADAIR